MARFPDTNPFGHTCSDRNPSQSPVHVQTVRIGTGHIHIHMPKELFTIFFFVYTTLYTLQIACAYGTSYIYGELLVPTFIDYYAHITIHVLNELCGHHPCL